MIGVTECGRTGDDPYPYAAVAMTVIPATTVADHADHLLMAISMAAL